MPGAIRSGSDLARVEAALAALRARFADAGFAPVEPGHLFPAETLLDLYGEDVRTRAFLFPDPVGGRELCLRPDFTAPVAIAHGAGGWDRAGAYSYAGPVFRLQEPGSTRPVEYLQAGIESVAEPDRPAEDARIFALIRDALHGLGVAGLRVTTGDLGIVFALLDALEMSEGRRALLRRHLWRPARFHALIDGWLARPDPPSPRRRALIAAAAEGPEAVARLADAEGEPVGKRRLSEIVERAGRLALAAAEPPLPAEQGALIEAVLGVEGPSGAALGRLRGLAAGAGVDLSAALGAFENRLDALARLGVDAGALPFRAAFGRNLEYYSGFVFEVQAPGRDDLPPLAGGGRYDAMTRRLGADAAVPAVGAMIRPEAVLAAAGGDA